MIVNVVWCRSWKGSADADVTRTFLQLSSDDLSNTANFTKLHRTLSQILLRFQTVTHYVTVIVDFEENFPRFFPGSHPSLNQPHRFIKASSWPFIISPSRAKNVVMALSRIPAFWWILGVPSPPPLRKKSVKQYFDPFQSRNSMNHVQLNIWPLSDWGQTGENQLNLNHFSEF